MSPRALCGLDRAARLCALAEFLCDTVHAVHGISKGPAWDSLEVEAKHAYYLEAEQLVARLKPLRADSALFEQIVTVARTEAAKVVGRISPSEPYGVDPRD